MGWLARHPRIISFYRVFVIPFLIAIWMIHSYLARYSFSFSYLALWLAAMTLGSWAGWLIFRRIAIEADKQKKLIRLPGTYSTLTLILLIFLSRYYFFFLHIIDPSTLANSNYIYTDLILTGFLIGIILGRGIRLTQSYNQAPHTDLHRF